jgi:hypothetical protein
VTGVPFRLSLRGHRHPLHHRTCGHLSGVGQGNLRQGYGPSRGLHPRAPLPLLYPSLCRMSSPSNRRAVPRPAVLRAALAHLRVPGNSATKTYGKAHGQGEPVIAKHRTSAFSGSAFEMILRARNIETLILMGHSTSGVILSTVRLAADLNY